MFRRIIVAFDGSERSHDALAVAQRLRDPDDGMLTLACVVPSPWHLPGGPRRMAAEEVALMLAGARARIPAGIPVRLRSPTAATAVHGLLVLAEAEAADLIVVGSSNHGDPGRVSLERTAGRVLHTAHCAVAVPPAGNRDADPFRHVGIAYDGTPDAGAALAAGYSIAAATGAAVTLLHVLPEHIGAPLNDAVERSQRHARLDAQQRLDRAADSAPRGINPRALLLFGAPGPAIAAACDGIVDLLILRSHGHGPIGRTLLDSISYQLMEGARHPVLVLPRRAAAPARPIWVPLPSEAEA